MDVAAVCFPGALETALQSSSWLPDASPEERRWRVRTVMALCILDRGATPGVQQAALDWLDEHNREVVTCATVSLHDRLRLLRQLDMDHDALDQHIIVTNDESPADDDGRIASLTFFDPADFE